MANKRKSKARAKKKKADPKFGRNPKYADKPYQRHWRKSK